MSSFPSNKVNMSLDEIIKQSKGNQKKNFNKGGRGSRNFNDRRRYNDKSRDDRKEVKEAKTERRTKLFVSNLQKDIVNSELRKIFSSVGTLKKCAIHWDNLGYSKGTADVEYEKAEDAQKAIKDYNEAEIEGVTMKVEYAKGKTLNKFRRSKTGRRNETKRNIRPNLRRGNLRGGMTVLFSRNNTNNNNTGRGVGRPRVRLGARNIRRNLK